MIQFIRGPQVLMPDKKRLHSEALQLVETFTAASFVYQKHYLHLWFYWGRFFPIWNETFEYGKS